MIYLICSLAGVVTCCYLLFYSPRVAASCPGRTHRLETYLGEVFQLEATQYFSVDDHGNLAREFRPPLRPKGGFMVNLFGEEASIRSFLPLKVIHVGEVMELSHGEEESLIDGDMIMFQAEGGVKFILTYYH